MNSKEMQGHWLGLLETAPLCNQNSLFLQILNTEAVSYTHLTLPTTT